MPRSLTFMFWRCLLSVFFLGSFRLEYALASPTTNGECQASTAESSCQQQQQQLEELSIGLEWFLNPDHLPFLVAQQHGIFEKMGLKVKLVEPTDHWEAGDEIAAGRLDVAVTEPLHLAQDSIAHLREQDERPADSTTTAPVLGFMRFLHTDGGVMYQTSKVQRPADMCGLTISYPGSPGPGGPAIVQTMVQADGKDDCDINSYGKYNGGFYHTQALADGKADLATLIFWNFEIPEARHHQDAVGDVGFFSLKDWGVPDFCQLVLITTPQRFQQRQGALRKLVLALRQATAVIHQYPDTAKEYYRRHVLQQNEKNMTQQELSIMEATLTATLPAFPNDFMMATDYYHHLMQWLVDTKQVDPDDAARVDPSQYWTNEIAW